uniref:Adrenomedullin n=1 Tax=Kryptolebias marmoratus TaxID=37003 RepID=A0A3Q3AW37_KRYMA
MVSSTSHGRFLPFLGGCDMEIAFLVLLTVTLTAASPLRLTQRSGADVVLSGAAESVGRSDESREQRAPLVKIVPFYSDDKHFVPHDLKHSMAAKLRPRRVPQRGCQLGTCQLHNLANTLYHISKMSGKEESKNANDPQGYGR